MSNTTQKHFEESEFITTVVPIEVKASGYKAHFFLGCLLHQIFIKGKSSLFDLYKRLA